jgi:hypothetical protein
MKGAKTVGVKGAKSSDRATWRFHDGWVLYTIHCLQRDTEQNDRTNLAGGFHVLCKLPILVPPGSAPSKTRSLWYPLSWHHIWVPQLLAFGFPFSVWISLLLWHLLSRMGMEITATPVFFQPQPLNPSQNPSSVLLHLTETEKDVPPHMHTLACPQRLSINHCVHLPVTLPLTCPSSLHVL